MKKQLKKKFEFSKILVIVAIIIFASYGIYSGMRYYSLVQLAIETGDNMILPDPSLAVTCVGGILGSILTYILYQGSLKWSLNKNQLTIDQATGIVSKIANGETKEIINDILENELSDNNHSDMAG